MSTTDPDFYQAPKFTPEPPQALPRQRGCFFYGCIIASILAVLFVILMAVLAFFAYRFASQMVGDYTSTSPRELPKVEMPAEKRQALKDRIDAFKKAIDAGTAAEPLVLTSDDLNALIEEDNDLKGKFFIKIDGDEIKGQVSMPLDPLAKGPLRAMLQGRYLNGEADVKASLRDGVLIVTLDSFEVNGKRPPDEIMKELREQNLAKDADKDAKNAERIRKIESLEVKDGQIIIKVRAKGTPATEKAEPKKDSPAEAGAPPAATVPKAEPPAKNGTPKIDDTSKTKAQPPAAEPASPKA